ncbi:hypothetical protein ACEWY4_024078 [Coilia grayii]|uniref:Potassium channel tetramerisation-type BTB domain-containing protein n=1 Tax=Coilia grayii TaxID=363190 RepID=A0ABD1IZA7_9TELE
MYQEVAFLAGSTERQFTTFHIPLENPHEITTRKGLFYKRIQQLLPEQEASLPPRDEGPLAHVHATARTPPPPPSTDAPAIINVGGIKYRIPWSTLDEFPLTRLGKLRSCSNVEELLDVCDDYDVSRNEFFFDRSPSAFRSIVTFLAAGKLRLLREMCALSFQEELLYWGVEEQSLEWCCLRKLKLRQEEHQEQLRREEEEAELASPQSCEEVQQVGSGGGGNGSGSVSGHGGGGSGSSGGGGGGGGSSGAQEETRMACCMRKLRDMVENPHSGLPGKIFACLSVVFVAITAVTLCISTMPDLRAEEERVSDKKR